MKKVFQVETTTDGRLLLYCSTGENTGDVEVIDQPPPTIGDLGKLLIKKKGYGK